MLEEATDFQLVEKVEHCLLMNYYQATLLNIYHLIGYQLLPVLDNTLLCTPDYPPLSFLPGHTCEASRYDRAC